MNSGLFDRGIEEQLRSRREIEPELDKLIDNAKRLSITGSKHETKAAVRKVRKYMQQR